MENEIKDLKLETFFLTIIPLSLLLSWPFIIIIDTPIPKSIPEPITTTTIPEELTDEETAADFGIHGAAIPYTVLNAPANNSNFTVSIFNITLNATVTDADGDTIDVYIYGVNSSNTGANVFYKSLLYQELGVSSGSDITYNWTTPVIQPDSSTVLLMHFDNRSEYGESEALVYDFALGINNGSIEGNAAPNISGGKLGGSFEFDGNNDWINITFNESLDVIDNNGNFSIFAWIRLRRAPSEANRVNTIFSQQGGVTPLNGKEWLVINKQNAFVSFLIGGGNLSDFDFASHLNEWVHVGMTYNGSTAIGYVNGGEGLSVVNTNIDQDANGYYRIGAKRNGKQDFNGSIDELVIFNRTLTSSEVKDLYRLKGGKYFWKVNISDSDGNNNESETFQFHVNTYPYTVLNAPANNSNFTVSIFNITLNATVTDADGDTIDVYIYGVNSSNTGANVFYKSLLYQELGVSSGSDITYNWTTPVIQPDSSTVLLYHFDNRSEYGESEALVYDFALGINNGSVYGNAAPNISGGKLGGSFEFDGNNDWINITFDSSLDVIDNDGNFSIFAWVRLRQANRKQAIFSQSGGSAGSSQNKEWLKINNVNILTSGLMATSLSDFNFSLHLDEWVHVGMTYNGSTAIGYVNGGEGTSTAKTGIDHDADGFYRIGAKANTQQDFNGSIDELVIFNRTLTSSEVKDLYRLRVGEYYWKVNVSDSDGNNNESVALSFSVTGGAPNSTDLNYPADGANLTDKQIPFNCIAYDNDGDLANVTLWGNWSSDGWHQEALSSVSGSLADVTFNVNLTYGNFIWSCLATDSEGNQNWSGTNYTFNINNLTSRKLTYFLASDLASGIETDDTSWSPGNLSDYSGLIMGRETTTTYDAAFVFNVSDIGRYDYFTFARLAILSLGNVTQSSVNLTISGAATDFVTNFTSGFRPSDYAKTETQINWTTEEWADGESAWIAPPSRIVYEHYTPNIAPIINEIISRPGWNETNKTIAIFIDDNNQNTGENNWINFSWYDPVNALSFKLELGETAKDTVQNEEFMTAVTHNSSLVSMIFKDDVDFYVEYGTSSGVYAQNSTILTDHPAYEPAEVTLDNLNEGTRYFYRARVRSNSSDDAYDAFDEKNFTTRRRRGESFVFDHVTDTHLYTYARGGSPEKIDFFENLTERIKEDNPDFVVDTGDTVLAGDGFTAFQKHADYRYELVRNFYENFSLPIYYLPGNHDGEWGWKTTGAGGLKVNLSIAARLKYWPNPTNTTYPHGGGAYEDYFAFDWGDALFVFLDTHSYQTFKPLVGEDWTLGEEQLDWLNTTLRNSDKKWKFIFSHHIIGGNDRKGGSPKYAYGDGGGKWSQIGDQKNINHLMEEYNAQFFVYGHVHFFAHDWANWSDFGRTNYTNYVLTAMMWYNLGAAERQDLYDNEIIERGYTRFEVSPYNVTFHFVNNTDGSYIYNYTLNNTPPNIDVVSPSNSSAESSTPVDFVFNYSDLEYDRGKNCTLFVDDTQKETQHNVVSGEETTFSVSLGDGSHDWYINCSDGALSNVSETRTLTVDTITPGIEYVPPSPDNATTQSADSIYVNVSASDDSWIYGFTNLDDSLVGWWRLDNDQAAGENSTFVYDWSGKGNNGTVYDNATPTSAGKFGGGFEFDGDVDYIKVPNDDSLTITTNLSISAWIKTKGITSRTQVIVYKYLSYGMTLSYDTLSFVAEICIVGDFCPGVVSTNPAIPNRWYHAVFTYDGEDMKLYINGVLNNTNNKPGTIDTSTNDVQIGHDWYNWDFNGTIDEILIFNRSLSDEEIEALYNASAPRFQDNYTNMTEGNHTFRSYVVDAAGNKNETELREVTVDTVNPTIEYVDPTPDNASTQSKNYTYVNVSASDENWIYGFTNFDDSLVGWWRMGNDASAGENSTFVYDWSGKGNNGTAQYNATPTTAGKFGGGFDFDGTWGYIITNDIGAVEGVNGLTVSLWFKPNQIPSSGIAPLVEKYGSFNTHTFSLYWHQTVNRIYFNVYNTSQDVGAGQYDSAITDTNWHHIVGVYNGSTVMIYLNTIKGGTVGSLTGPTRDTNKQLRIGHLTNFLPTTNGTIDEVLVFNRSLSEQEIEALYNASAPRFQNNYTNLSEGIHTFKSYVIDAAGNKNETELREVTADTVNPTIEYVDSTPDNATTQQEDYTYVNVSASDENQIYGFTNFDDSLVGWWRLDNDASAGENSTFVYDWSGKGNNGTAVNNATSTTAGKFGGGFEFDGDGGYIDLGEPSSLTGKGDYSISAWFKTQNLDAHYFAILSRGRSNTGWDEENRQYLLVINGWEDRMRFILGNTTDKQRVIFFGANSVSLNTWHYVGIAVNSTDIVYCLDDSCSSTTRNSVIVPDYNYTYIGTDDTTMSSVFNGTIDEVIIFNRSLSSDEIAALYNASAPRFKNNYTNLTDGLHTFKSYAVDAAGNKNETEERSVVVDTINPEIHFVAPTPETDNYSQYLTINVSASDENWIYGFTNLDDSLVGWWRLDNDASAGENGTWIYDWSGKGNNGTVEGNAAPTTAGKFGGGFELDGGAGGVGSVEIPYSDSLAISENITLSIWVKAKVTDDGSGDYFMMKGEACWSSSKKTYSFGIKNNGDLHVSMCNGTSNPGFGVGLGNIVGKWYHVATTYNGTDFVVYVNGTLSVSYPFGGDIGNTNKLKLGSTLASSTFNGTIDEVLIFNRSLLAEEIAALYNASAPRFQNNYTGLEDGNHTFKNYVIDAAGNKNETEERTMTIDATPPSTSVNNVEGDTAPTYYDTSNDGSTDVIVDGEENMSCRYGTSDVTYSGMTDDCTVTGMQANCSISASEGTPDYYVSCIDWLGNEQNSSQNLNVVSLVVDWTAPNTTDNSTTDVHVPTYTVTISEYDNIDGDPTTYYCKDTIGNCSPETWIDNNGFVDFNETERGTNYLRYYSVDDAGNNQTVVNRTIRINQLPNFTSADDNASIVMGGSTITITTVASDPDGQTLKLFVCKNESVNHSGCFDEYCSNTTATNNPSCSFTTETDNTIHYWYAFLYDSLNESTINKSGNYTTDSIAPTITIHSPLNATYSQTWIYLYVTLSENGSWVKYSLNGENVSMDNYTLTDWYSNVTLSNGSHQITFYASDLYGNVGSDTISFTIDISANDTIPPVIIMHSPVNGSYHNRTYVMANITLTENGSWVGYCLDNCLTNQTMDGSGMNWYRNVTNLSEQLHQMLFYANDSAGNVGNSSVAFTVDETPPQYTLYNNTPNPKDNESVTCYSHWTDNVELSNAIVEENLTGAFTNHSVQLSGTSGWANYTDNVSTPGAYQCRVYSYDTTGNLNATPAWTFNVADVTPPNISNISYYPTSLDELDPNTTITVNATVTDTGGLSEVLLQYMKETVTVWNNITMTNISSTYQGNFTPTTSGIWIFRVMAIDGSNNTVESTNTSLNVTNEYTWTRTPAEFNVSSALIGTNGTIGNLTINNTGDFLMDFIVTSNKEWIYYNGSLEPFAFNLTEGNTTITEITATAPMTEGEYNVSIRVNNTNENATPSYLYTNTTFVSYVSGPYLFATITTYTSEVVQGQSRIDLEAMIKNIGNEDATGVWLIWILPEGWTSRSALNRSLGNLGVGETAWNSITVDIGEEAPTGNQTLSIMGSSIENMTAIASKLVSVRLLVIGDGGGLPPVPATPGWTPEPELPPPIYNMSIGVPERVMMGRGQTKDIRVNITNTGPYSTLRRVYINITGFPISVIPYWFARITYNETKNATLRINTTQAKAEDYLIEVIVTSEELNGSGSFTLRVYEFSQQFALESVERANRDIKAMEDAGFVTIYARELLKKARKAYEEERYGDAIRLYNEIHERMENAFRVNDLINQVRKRISEAETEGLSITIARDVLEMAITAFEAEDYERAEEYVQNALLIKIETAPVAITGRAIAGRGVVGGVPRAPIPWARVILVLTVTIVAASIGYMKSQTLLIPRKIETLNKKQKLIDKLIKEAEDKYYIKETISEEEYRQTIDQYEEKRAKLKEKIIHLKSKKMK